MKNRKICLLAAVFAIGLAAAGCGGKTSEPVSEKTSAESAYNTESTHNTDAGQVASDQETGSPIDVVEEGMMPVYGEEIRDGVYPVKVDSSSRMFQITSCSLTVKDGKMSAVMTMGGTGYLKLYMGTGEEAVKASEKDYIPYAEAEQGIHTFEVPVEALDMGINCAAFSKKKEKWYDRILVFRADSLPQEAFADGKIATAECLGLKDGNYTVEVTLEGGSGKAAVESPALLRVENGEAFAVITWGSSNYDYMKVDGEKIDLISTEGNSAFEIPVTGFDWKMAVIADTVAMSEPHEIEYTLIFDSSTIKQVER